MSKTNPSGTTAHQKIHALARQIPKGRVSTYGRLAAMAGCSARMAGYAMAAASEGTGVPWHRVINSQGRISIPGPEAQALQRQLLEREGIRFDEDGRIDLKRYVWPD